MTRRLRTWLLRLNSRRYRRIFFACLATLGISASLLGVILFMRWRVDHAVRHDTSVVLNQASLQLVRALQSRRGTLTLLRDTLDRQAGLNMAERKALAESAVAHTRHLLGIGLLRAGQPVVWWVQPSSTTAQERARLNRAMAQHAKLRNTWRVPSTLTVFSHSDRPLLIMLEPLRSSANRKSAIVGIFDLKPLLADFFELTLQQPYPVQLLDANRLLYRSRHWQIPTEERRHAWLQRPIRLDAVQWAFQMQPGATQAAQAITAFHVLLLAFSGLSGLATIGIIWLLAMRTWILQRAVWRRTQALRRTTERLRQLATTDELTGLSNRRFFLERWQWECERARRYGRPLGCLMIDVNEFKQINDVLGHHMGDLVLKQVAQELKAHLRQSDMLARFGGDEFIVALLETSRTHATTVAEKLRQVTITGPWMSHEGLGPVRLSVGLSHLQPDVSPQHVIQQADAALYASRHAAKDRLTTSQPRDKKMVLHD